MFFLTTHPDFTHLSAGFKQEKKKRVWCVFFDKKRMDDDDAQKF